MSKITSLGKKTMKALKKEGIHGTVNKTIQYVKTANARKRISRQGDKAYRDVLFINGCDYEALPHPPRYRVQHQMEQLRAYNITCDEIFYTHIDLNLVRCYRTFVIFRCTYNEQIGEFVRLAQKLNKKVLYDIDDLVIDRKYTDTIKYLETMSASDKEAYDAGVDGMNQLLRMCDGAVTTTEGMAEELKHYVPEVFINRNVASEEMLALSETAYQNAVDVHTDRNVVKLGYFSGSITHNDDFRMIRPAIVRLMEQYPQVELHIVGLLDIPAELEAYRERVIAHPFVDWRKLPELIASVQINLAPLESGIFNDAKSENKWIEAALVRVPTIASDTGAFARMIEDGRTGILCKTPEEWFQGIESLILDARRRYEIGMEAYRFCKEKCTTLHSGLGLQKFIKSFCSPNIAFVLPSLHISGGAMVAMEHARVLRSHGVDVTIVNIDLDDCRWCNYGEYEFPVLPAESCSVEGRFEKAVATMWVTVSFLEQHSNIGEKYYLVQNLETNFYAPGEAFRSEAGRTYAGVPDVRYLTISKWCRNWLKEDYGQDSGYLPNGLHTERYAPVERDFSGRIRILIEGDCSAAHKNVDESFRIANQLDRDKYEIWYMSYNAQPKEWYHVDRFLNKVPYEKVADVYRECHILLKTSLLESFSYPPLEMMATGGYAVVVPNGGNMEYLIDEENCLLYPAGEIEKGLQAIHRICEDEGLRERLYQGGQKAAGEREWKNLERQILKFYEYES